MKIPICHKKQKKKIARKAEIKFSELFFFFVNFALVIKCVAKMKEETIIK